MERNKDDFGNIIQIITTPSMEVKCPKCHRMVLANEVAISNKCCYCKYVFPYPFIKAREIEKFLRSNKGTYGEFSELVLNALDGIENRDEKMAFLRATYKLVLENFEWQQMIRKRKIA